MIRIGMSTSSAFPLPTEQAFELAQRVGFDGVEVMVTSDSSTRDVELLRELSARYSLPVLSVHAPVLLLTQLVWGTDPRVKLERSAELAADLGADTVVVHPPFRWQGAYAQAFLNTIREISWASGVQFAVENMFPWTVRGRSMKAYSPGWNPVRMDCDAATLDFSHASLSGVDTLAMVDALGERLRHVHLCDGSGSASDDRIFDEHLVPGRGTQPVAEVLAGLAASGWNGSIIAEVNTRRARSEAERVELLVETLEFARAALRGPAPIAASPTAAPVEPPRARAVR